jgi:hypothetical protein
MIFYQDKLIDRTGKLEFQPVDLIACLCPNHCTYRQTLRSGEKRWKPAQRQTARNQTSPAERILERGREGLKAIETDYSACEILLWRFGGECVLEQHVKGLFLFWKSSDT